MVINEDYRTNEANETRPLLANKKTSRLSFNTGFYSAWAISSLLMVVETVVLKIFSSTNPLWIIVPSRLAITMSGWNINHRLTKTNGGDKLDKGTRFADNIGMQAGLPFVLSGFLSFIGIGLEAQFSLPILAATIVMTSFFQTADMFQHGKELTEAIEMRDQTAEGKRINNMGGWEYARWKGKEIGKTFIDRSTVLTMLISFLGSYGAGRFDEVPAPVSALILIEMTAHLIGYASDKARRKLSDNWTLDLFTAVTTISLSLGLKSTSMLFGESFPARMTFDVLGAVLGGMNRSGRTWVREIVETPKTIKRMASSLWRHQPEEQSSQFASTPVNGMV